MLHQHWAGQDTDLQLKPFSKFQRLMGQSRSINGIAKRLPSREIRGGSRVANFVRVLTFRNLNVRNT